MDEGDQIIPFICRRLANIRLNVAGGDEIEIFISDVCYPMPSIYNVSVTGIIPGED
jgi:hypothetical protein